jgi:hypothetical protein
LAKEKDPSLQKRKPKDVVLLADLVPRKDPKGGGKPVFGETTSLPPREEETGSPNRPRKK